MANNKVVLNDGTTLMDITDTTAIASDVVDGKFFYESDGQRKSGTGSRIITLCDSPIFNSDKGGYGITGQSLIEVVRTNTKYIKIKYGGVFYRINANEENLNIFQYDGFNFKGFIIQNFATKTLSGARFTNLVSFYAYSDNQKMPEVIILDDSKVAPFSLSGKKETMIFQNIYVPDSLVNSYKTATNWSFIADKIFPLSEWEGE